MKNPLKMSTFVIFTLFLTNEIKILLLYKAKKWDFFFSTLCLFLENVFVYRHFCLFYRFLNTFILIFLLSYKNYITSSLLYKNYIPVYFSTRCLLFSDLIYPVSKIAQKLDPQIVQHAKTNKNNKNVLTNNQNECIVKSVKRTTDRHSVLSVLNISFLIHNFIVDINTKM